MRNIDRHNMNESGLYGLFNDAPVRNKKNISQVNMRPTNANQCHVYYDGNSVYSNAKFYTGDIIEICPSRRIEKNSLYTKDVRDMVFEIEPNTLFVIPMGYCQYYNIIDKQHPEANCDYEWDDGKHSIVIRALCTIPKNSRLILNIEK